MTKNSDGYDEKDVKIKFNIDNKLPLIKTPSMIIVVRAVFIKIKNILGDVCINYE